MVYASAEVTNGLFDDITNILVIVSVRKLMFLSIHEDGISSTALQPQNYGFSDDQKISSEIFKNTEASESYVIITVSAGFAVVSMNSLSVILKRLYYITPTEYRFFMNLRICVVISDDQVWIFKIDQIIYDGENVLGYEYFEFYPTNRPLYLAESGSFLYALGVSFQYAVFIFNSNIQLFNIIKIDHQDISALYAWQTTDGTQSFVIASKNYLELFENFSSKETAQKGCIQEYKQIFPDFYALQTDVVRDGIRKLDIVVAFNLANTLSIVLLREEGQIVQKKIDMTHQIIKDNISMYQDVFMRVNIDVKSSVLFVVLRNLSTSSLIELIVSYNSFSVLDAKLYTSVFYFSIEPWIFAADSTSQPTRTIFSNYQGNALQIIQQISSGAATTTNSRNCASIPSHLIAWVEDTTNQVDGTVIQTIKVVDYITLAEFSVSGLSNLKYIKFLDDQYIFFITSTLLYLQPISIPPGVLTSNTHEYIDDEYTSFNTFKAGFSEEIGILVIYAEKIEYGYYLTPQYFTYDLHTLTKLGELYPQFYNKDLGWIQQQMHSNYQFYFEISPFGGIQLVISIIELQIGNQIYCIYS